MSSPQPVERPDRLAVRYSSVPDPLQYQTREEYEAALEQQRRDRVRVTRMYVDGSQFDEANVETIRELATSGQSYGNVGEKALARMRGGLFGPSLPEHERVHEYSTQVGEAVQYICDRLTHDMAVEVVEPKEEEAETVDDGVDIRSSIGGKGSGAKTTRETGDREKKPDREAKGGTASGRPNDPEDDPKTKQPRTFGGKPKEEYDKEKEAEQEKDSKRPKFAPAPGAGLPDPPSREPQELSDQSKQTKDILQRCFDASPELSGTVDDDEVSWTPVVKEALIAGDVGVHCRWDPKDRRCWLEFWPSEQVEIVWGDERSDRPTKVVVEQVEWLFRPLAQRVMPVTVKRVWEVKLARLDPYKALGDPVAMTQQELNEVPEAECIEEWRVDTPESPENPLGYEVVARYPTGVPFVPWGAIRGNRRGIRESRGSSIVSQQALKIADRYNAVEQTSWLIARFNSHGTLAVVGDNALIQLAGQGNRIAKDIVDVLTFPGGSALTPITLPTDATMIEHQKALLTDSMFGTFGLARVEPSALEGMGNVTGYALEILNSKAEGTFSRIRRMIARDVKAICNLILDCQAHWESKPAILDGLLDGPPPEEPADPVEQRRSALTMDPKERFSARGIEVRMGSGYVVDQVMIRDDYNSKLISVQEALRKRGYTNDEIEQILAELDHEAEKTAERQSRMFDPESGEMLSTSMVPEKDDEEDGPTDQRSKPSSRKKPDSSSDRSGSTTGSRTKAGSTVGSARR